MKKIIIITVTLIMTLLIVLKINNISNISKESCINGNADLYECMQHKEMFNNKEYEMLLKNKQLYFLDNKNHKILIEKILIKKFNNTEIEKNLIDELKKCAEKNDYCASFFKGNEFKLDKNVKLEDKDFGNSLGYHIDGYAK